MERERKRLRIVRLKDKGRKEEYKLKVTEMLNTEWGNETRNANAEEVFETFSNVLLFVTGNNGEEERECIVDRRG